MAHGPPSHVLLPLMIVASVASIPRSRWYWSYMRQAEGYVSEVEKFKTEHGYYPDETLKTSLRFQSLIRIFL